MKSSAGRALLGNRNVIAWLLMAAALAVHVFDEAISGFLPFYRETVQSLKERIGFFPMPMFTFEVWLIGLIALIIILFLLTPIVHRGSRFIRWFVTGFGALMIANALGHMLGSFYFGNVLPGFWSSSFLLLTSMFVVYRGITGEWR